MTHEDGKRLVRRYVEEVWNARNADPVSEFFAPDYKRHLSPTTSPLDGEGQNSASKGFSRPSRTSASISKLSSVKEIS